MHLFDFRYLIPKVLAFIYFEDHTKLYLLLSLYNTVHYVVSSSSFFAGYRPYHPNGFSHFTDECLCHYFLLVSFRLPRLSCNCGHCKLCFPNSYFRMSNFLFLLRSAITFYYFLISLIFFRYWHFK